MGRAYLTSVRLAVSGAARVDYDFGPEEPVWRLLMMNVRGSLSGSRMTAGLALAAMALAGCVVEVSVWTPIGTDASARGTWTVNGATASAGTCDAAGINSVEIQFSNRFDSPVIPPQFVFDCADGGFNLSNVLAAGTYDATYIVRTNTRVITATPSSFTVSFGSEAIFDNYDIIVSTTPVFNPKGDDFTMDGMWTINGGAATAATCTAAGIDAVQLVIQQAGEIYTEPGFIFPCAGGNFDTRTLAPPIRFTFGSYMTFWRALDASDTNIGMSSPLALIVNAPITHSTLATADFVVAPLESMTINLTYDTVVGPTMSDTNCAGAGVTAIFYTLTDITGGLPGTVVAETAAAGIACTGQIIFDDTVVMGGRTYSIYIEGANAAGQKNWNAMDATLDVAVGTPEFYNIALTKVM